MKDTFNWGVDSPVNMASLTIHVPLKIIISQGTGDSSFERTIEQISPGNKSFDIIDFHLWLLKTWISNGFGAIVLNSFIFLNLYYSDNKDDVLILFWFILIAIFIKKSNIPTWKTTVASNTKSMKRVKIE